MKKTRHVTLCAHCAEAHNMITQLSGDDKPPRDGAITLCAYCGGWLLLDENELTGTRVPSDHEAMLIENDRRCQQIHQCWREREEARQRGRRKLWQ